MGTDLVVVDDDEEEEEDDKEEYSDDDDDDDDNWRNDTDLVKITQEHRELFDSCL